MSMPLQHLSGILEFLIQQSMGFAQRTISYTPTGLAQRNIPHTTIDLAQRTIYNPQ